MKKHILLLLLLFGIKTPSIYAEDCSGKAQIPPKIMSKFSEINSTYKNSQEKVSEIEGYIKRRNNNEPCGNLIPILSNLHSLTKKKFEQFDKKRVNNKDIQEFLALLNNEIESIKKSKERDKERDKDDAYKILQEQIKTLEREKDNLDLSRFFWKTLTLIFFFTISVLYLFAKFLPKRFEKLFFGKQRSYQQNSNKEVGELVIPPSQTKEENFQPHESSITTQKQIDNTEVQKLKIIASQLYNENTDLKDRVIALENENSELKNLDSKKDKVAPIVNNQNKESEVFIVESNFYLSVPGNIDGKTVFYDKRELKYDSLKTCYKFSLENSSTPKAQFIFADDNPYGVSNAIQFYDTYIDPACEYDEMNRKATRIITVRNGEAIKKGDVWEVTRKAKIEFK